MVTIIWLFRAIVDGRLLCRLFRQSIFSFCQQIGKHLYHRHQIWSMDQICAGNRRITIEYAKFYGKLKFVISIFMDILVCTILWLGEVHVNHNSQNRKKNTKITRCFQFLMLQRYFIAKPFSANNWNRRTEHKWYASISIAYAQFRGSWLCTIGR